MRITNVEPILLRGRGHYGTTGGAAEASDSGDWQALVKVTTDEGLVGWSDVETLSTAAAAIISGPGMQLPGFMALRDILVGEDPLDAEAIWRRMFVGTVYYGRRGIALHCISAIDNCLWSIRAQAANRPLCELLGRRQRDKVTAYASTLFRDTPEAMTEAARGYVEHGFSAVKFGWGGFGYDLGRDRELVAAAREALGPERHLLVDPGWYDLRPGSDWYTRNLDENLALCEMLKPFNVGWVEDFIHPELFDDYATVRSKTGMPLAAGEQLATPWEFRRFLEGGCVDVVQPDLSRCGGLTVARQIADMARQHGVDLVPHSWLTDLLTAYSLHLIAVLPRAKFVEFNVAQGELTRGVCGGAMALNHDGTVNVPTGPGLGVQVDEAFIRAHRAN